MARAQEKLPVYTSKPECTAPGALFDIRKCAADKKMRSIPNTSGAPRVSIVRKSLPRILLVPNNRLCRHWKAVGHPA